MKEIEDDTNKWKDILCLWTGRINSVKMTIVPRQSTDLMQSLLKYQWHFQRTRTNNSKICLETQKTP